MLLALVLRVAAIAADDGYLPANDAFEYDLYARSIAAGDGYPRTIYLLQGGPTAVRGPGYPFLLGGVYALTGDSLTAGRLMGAALGALAVLLLYLVTRRIWGRRTALVTAFLAAVFPPLVLLSRDLLSESLFIVLVLGAILCVLDFRRSGGMLRWAVAAGVLCGLAALTRNTGVVLAAVIAFGVWTAQPRWSARSLAAPAAVLACVALVIAPWTVRNATEFGRFIPITTSPGIATGGTYNESSFEDSATHGAWRDPQIVPSFTPLFTTPGIDEGTVDATLRREAREFAWEHPGYVAETSAWNLLRMFEIADGSVVDHLGRVVDDRGIGSAVSTADRVALALAAILALLGVLAIARTREAGKPGSRVPAGPLFLWLAPLLMIATAIPIAGLPRYRLPADPFLLILVAIGAVWVAERLSRRKQAAA